MGRVASRNEEGTALAPSSILKRFVGLARQSLPSRMALCLTGVPVHGWMQLCRIRDVGPCAQVFYTDLLKHFKAHHMLADAQDIEVGQAAEGILGRSHDYHGFVALTVEHAA